MARWCTLTLCLLVTGLIGPAAGWAQGYPAPYPPPGSEGVVPAGWQTSSPYPGAYPTKAKYRNVGPQGPLARGPGRTIYEELPDDQGWLYEDTPLERILKQTFRHGYFRTDYLLWDISDPGNTLLSAPPVPLLDPVSSLTGLPIPISDVTLLQATDSDGNNIFGTVPSLAGVFNNENNGLRLTFGTTVFDGGVIEANIWGLQNSTSVVGFPDIRVADINLDGVININDINDPRVGSLYDVDLNGDGIFDAFGSGNLVDAVLQGVLVDGASPAGTNLILVNDLDYEASLKTEVWGTEANYLFEAYNPNADLIVTPLLGIRYLNFREDLRQRGVYTDPVLDEFAEPVPPDPVTGAPITQATTRKIDSTAINNLYGPQIGVRGEIRRKWLAIGATPKVMLGLNTYRTELATSQVLSAYDASQHLYKKETTFGVIGDLEVHARIYLGEHLSLHAGYNFMWAGLLTRPADNIIYNIKQPSTQSDNPFENLTQSDFGLDPSFSGAIIQGLSVGGQLEY